MLAQRALTENQWVNNDLPLIFMRMNVYMRYFSRIAGFILMLGLSNNIPAFALEKEILPGQQEINKGLHAASPSHSSSIYMNVEGKLKEIQGDIYILEGSKDDQPIRIQVAKDTAFPNGHKKPGEAIQALVSAQDGHALIIR